MHPYSNAYTNRLELACLVLRRALLKSIPLDSWIIQQCAHDLCFEPTLRQPTTDNRHLVGKGADRPHSIVVKIDDAVRGKHANLGIAHGSLCNSRRFTRSTQRQSSVCSTGTPSTHGLFDFHFRSKIILYSEVINTHTVGSLTIPRASIKWV